MLLVEFFDSEIVENISSCLALNPERMILIGDRKKVMERQLIRYQDVFDHLQLSIETEIRVVNKNALDSIVEQLCMIVQQDEEVVFDLMGGDEIMLAAVGITYERCRDRHIQLHRFNLRSGRIMDIDHDGRILWDGLGLGMTIADLVHLYGGDVVYDPEASDRKPAFAPSISGKTMIWDTDREFADAIWAMWDIYRINPVSWNHICAGLARLQSVAFRDAQPWEIRASVEAVEKSGYMEWKRLFSQTGILGRLRKQGLIRQYAYNESQLEVQCADKIVRRCLTNPGQLLELVVYEAAMEAVDDEGRPLYQDVLSGVYIDWDGITNGLDTLTQPAVEADTINEIDVIMMHGMLPVFISCKSGKTDVDELYKLKVVSDHFGSKYCKAVLVGTSPEQWPSPAGIRQRAKDMNIRVIDELQLMHRQEVVAVIAGLWRNQG